MENILQCKVDKSQVPLIQSCQKQLDSLEQSEIKYRREYHIVDDKISDINNLNSKLNQNFEEALSFIFISF